MLPRYQESFPGIRVEENFVFFSLEDPRLARSGRGIRSRAEAALIERNWSYGNEVYGIEIEQPCYRTSPVITPGGVVATNIVSVNGLAPALSPAPGAGIRVEEPPTDYPIFGNTLFQNFSGIAVIQNDSDPMGPRGQVLLNDLVAEHPGYCLLGSAGGFAVLDHSDCFDTSLGLIAPPFAVAGLALRRATLSLQATRRRRSGLGARSAGGVPRDRRSGPPGSRLRELEANFPQAALSCQRVRVGAGTGPTLRGED